MADVTLGTRITPENRDRFKEMARLDGRNDKEYLEHLLILGQQEQEDQSAYEAEYAMVNRALQPIYDQFKSLTLKTAAQLKDGERQIEEAEQKAAQAIEAAKAKVDAQAGQVVALQAALKAKTDTLDQTAQDLAKSLQAEVALQAQVDTLTGTIEVLKKANVELERYRDNYQEQEALLQEREAELFETKKEILDLRTRTAELEATKDVIEKAHQAELERIKQQHKSDLKDQEDRLRFEIPAKAELKRLQDKDQFLNQVREAQERYEAKQKVIDSQNEIIQELREKLEVKGEQKALFQPEKS